MVTLSQCLSRFLQRGDHDIQRIRLLKDIDAALTKLLSILSRHCGDKCLWHNKGIFNQIGKFATADVLGCTYESMPDSWALAKELETWFYFYKRVYRSISEESELRYIQELVCWYGDYLRQIK